jgi:outer membrane protein assembly factor BamB
VANINVSINIERLIKSSPSSDDSKTDWKKRMFFKKLTTRCLLTLVYFGLCGCGGSDNDIDGTSSSSGGSAPTLKVSFMPAQLQAELIQTSSTEWTVTATVEGPNVGTIYVKVVDNGGVILNPIDFDQLSSRHYRTSFRISPKLLSGEYSSNLRFHFCSDPACETPYPGSPWYLPYKLSVKSHTNLTALNSIEGFSGWNSRFGDVRNTGYVPITLNPDQFSYRWFKALDVPLVGEVITEGENVFFLQTVALTASSYFFNVTALDGWDGRTSWRQSFASDSRGVGLTANKDLLYFMRYDSSPPSAHFTGLDPENGLTIYDHKIADERYAVASALVDGDYFYVGGVFANGYALSALTKTSGEVKWSLPFQKAFEDGAAAPTSDDQNIYSFTHSACNPIEFCVPAGLRAIDKKTGAVSSFIADPAPTIVDHGENLSPILTDEGVLALNGKFNPAMRTADVPNISLYDIVNKVVRWTVSDMFVYKPVVANGIVYSAVSKAAIDDDSTRQINLQAMRLTDGELLWSLPVSSFPSYPHYPSNMIITDNILFMSAGPAVYAIDISSQEVVWRYPFGGLLSLSEKAVLYVHRAGEHDPYAQYGSILAAINLR